VNYRVSLDRECGRRITSKTEAEQEGDRVRNEIRNGRYGASATRTPVEPLTFRQFADIWQERRGFQLANAKDNRHRLDKIEVFVLPATNPPLAFGDKPLNAITTDDVEAYRDHRKAAGLSAVTVNHDLKLMRKMFNWGIRKGYLERTPFKIGTEAAITLEREIPRNKRFESDDVEEKLLDAANPDLRGIVIAMLDTGCRPGEILSMQWKDVNLGRKELTIQAVKAKTRTARIIPISTRLNGVLEMRRHDPAGREFGPDAYVFGDALGRRTKSVRTAWENACEKAGLKDFQIRDLRHEAGSRFEEAGVPLTYVSTLLGHTNLTTTSRYLNIHHSPEGTASPDATVRRSPQEQSCVCTRFAQRQKPLTSRCAGL
jgi:integrase